MLKPASPAGWPQPMIRSSMSRGSSPGTLSSAALTICAARSSGRRSTSEPLLARPMGERAAETMTASGMESSLGQIGFRPLCESSLWQSRGVRHRYECPMRWADLDQLGHVNNVVYVDYLQEARVSMLRAHGRGPEALAEGLVVVRPEVTYLKPLAFDFRPVSIECCVTDIRAATFTMAYEVFEESDEGERTVY